MAPDQGSYRATGSDLIKHYRIWSTGSKRDEFRRWLDGRVLHCHHQATMMTMSGSETSEEGGETRGENEGDGKAGKEAVNLNQHQQDLPKVPRAAKVLRITYPNLNLQGREITDQRNWESFVHKWPPFRARPCPFPHLPNWAIHTLLPQSPGDLWSVNHSPVWPSGVSTPMPCG